MARQQPNRWLILSIGLSAQATSSMFLYGLPMLLPQIRGELQLSLTSAAWLVVAPSLGLLATLIVWGALADRRGERGVMAVGQAMAGAFLLAAAAAPSNGARFALLVLAGVGAASVNAASGRVVLGWFAAHERGTAMGVRQTAQPLGVALAALILPPVADAYGVGWALVVPAVMSLVMSLLVLRLVVDPPRTQVAAGERLASPYRAPTLWRLHASSALLVAPQFAVAAFALVYLVDQRGWSAAAAGRLLFCFQLGGAVGRLAVGRWSDLVGSRLRPMRIVAVASAVTMLALGVSAGLGSELSIVAIGIGTVVTVADNGLGFTSVAELAGSEWAGRAIGVQNTAQNIAGFLTPPLLGALIVATGFGTGFAAVAVFPLIAVAATPVAAETARRVARRPEPVSARV